MRIQKTIIFLVVVFLSLTIASNKVEAVTDLGNYIKIQLDIGDTEIFEGKSSAGTASTFDVTANSYSPGATTYECALLLTEEDNGVFCSDEYVTWVVNQNILGVGVDLNADTTLGRINCCGGANPACKKDWFALDPCGDRCTLVEAGGGAGDVFSQNYGVFWSDLCGAGDCSLLSGAVGPGRNYSFPNEILCETTWRRCDDVAATCYTYNGREYACTGAAGGMTWDNCTAAGMSCVGGVCVAVAGLTLTVSASSTTIPVDGISTINFEVTKSGAAVVGATVNGISATNGSVSSGICVTGGGGTCGITYTAPLGLTGIFTISATNATDGVSTPSGPASVMITVASGDFLCDPFGAPDYSDACGGPLTVLDTCASLNGAGPGCVGVWQNCGSSCNAGCNGVCGSCVTPYQACNCVCVAGGCNNDGVQNNGETGIDCGGGGCPACACTTIWGPWSACAGAPGTQTSSNTGTCVVPDQSRLCCDDDSNCVIPSPFCNALAGPAGQCVNCITSDDCAGTDVCDNGICIPCSDEGEDPGDADLCCAGLSYLDLDDDGSFICTSACDPNAWFFCNPLRGSVETIAQAGETMLGYILGLIGSIALLFIIIAGIMYMTSAGNEEKISSSKRILSGAVIGLMIALLAYGLLHVIMTVLGM